MRPNPPTHCAAALLSYHFLEHKIIWNKVNENDIKELYKMIAQLQAGTAPGSKKFARLDVEQKLLAIHQELLKIAKQTGITLPTRS